MITESVKTVVKGLITEVDDMGIMTIIDKDDTDTCSIVDIVKDFVGSEVTISISKSEKKI